MAQIGTFIHKGDGYVGRIRTFILDMEIEVRPAEDSDADNAPSYRVFRDGVEVGAAWDRTSDKTGPYLSVTIDDPTFAQPMHAALFESSKKDTSNLTWNRRKKQTSEG